VDTLRVILRSNDLVAVLGREIPVRLVNISGSGCLVATTTTLHTGATASLSVDVDGVEYGDDVRVARCTQLEGSSEYHLGLEFLWTSAPGERCLRRMIVNLPGVKKDNVVEFAKPRLAERRTIGRHSRS
jgi:PilZ domain